MSAPEPEYETQYFAGLAAECLTHRSQEPGASRLETVVGRLDTLGAHVDFALCAVVSRVHEHVQDHGPAVGISAPLPRRDVPRTLQLLGRNLWQHLNHVVERLLQQLHDR